MSFYNNNQYPRRNQFPYPKAGLPIPKTLVFLVNTRTLDQVKLKPVRFD